MYITQRLKNQAVRKRRQKQLSVIISERRLSQIANQNTSRKNIRRNITQNSQIQRKLKIFDQTPDSQFNFFDQELQQRINKELCRNFGSHTKKKNFHIKNKYSKENIRAIEPSQRIKKMNIQKQLQKKAHVWNINSSNIRNQNIKKLQMFIKGAYDSQLDQYSQFVNLSTVDQFRKNFYIFDNIYRWASEANSNQKMNIEDVAGQKLKDIVFLNDQKQNTGIPQLSKIMKRYRIVQ